MEPGTLMTNCVSLRPSTHAKDGFLYLGINEGGKRTTISYTTHMEKLPKESWGLSRPL